MARLFMIDDLERLWPSLDWDFTDDFYLQVEPRFVLEIALVNEIAALFSSIATPLAVASDGMYPPQLTNGAAGDARNRHSGVLASLNLPAYTNDAKELIALRRSSDALAEFRAALDIALGTVVDIPVDEFSIAAAQSIISDVLKRQLHEVGKEADRSPWRKSAGGFVRRLSFSGIGAAAGAELLRTLGSPMLGAATGLVSGTAVNLAETTRELIEELRDRRSAQTIWSIVTAFSPAEE